MNKLNKLNMRLFLIAAMIGGVFFLTNCGGGSATTTTTPNNGTTTIKPADSPKTEATKPETVSTDSVGVPECDEYIKKYEACLLKIAQKAPQIEPDLKKSFITTRNGFKEAASSPQGKAMLPSQCKQMTETARQSYSSVYACEF